MALTDEVVAETKIERLVALVRDELPPAEPVLLFTEYKTTQALVVNALHRQFGFGSATFINGDDRLDGLEQAAGGDGTVNQPREQAAEAFNAGRVRFLVSTEAGGEGIDLQERCAVLVHVDMPWNPMRLHQRVGRLSRYGQRRPVTAYILRNPDTVEARIWDLLNEKLERVQQALSAVMEQQEDISQLVIGMAGPALFNELYSGAQGMSGERLTAWFDEATATLGGRDVVETVRELLGSVSHFDFQQVGRDLPQVDVPDLERFFTLAVGRHKRRVFKHPDGLGIKAPEAWKSRSYAVRDRYDGLVFDRDLRGANAASRVLGVGHTLFDSALDEARNLPARVAALDGLPAPVLVLSIEDEVTGTGSLVHRLIFGVTEVDGQPRPMRDWELLKLLNGATLKGAGSEPGRCGTPAAQAATVDRLKNAFESGLADTRARVAPARVLARDALCPRKRHFAERPERDRERRSGRRIVAKWTRRLPDGQTRAPLLRISIDPDICFGKPCIRGHRIWVSLVLDLLASGWTVDQLLDEYPGIEDADVLACIAYGAEMSRERYVDVPLEMNIKLDENLVRRGAAILRAAGHQVTTVAEERLSAASDEQLAELSFRPQVSGDARPRLRQPPSIHSVALFRHRGPPIAGRLRRRRPVSGSPHSGRRAGRKYHRRQAVDRAARPHPGISRAGERVTQVPMRRSARQRARTGGERPVCRSPAAAPSVVVRC